MSGVFREDGKGYRFIHGHRYGQDGRASRTYRIWANMKKRCSNPNYPEFHLYGGRGITFDSKWANFEGFLEDMGVAPSGRSLDRIDNSKGYSKENCRWATLEQQGRNKRNNVRYEFQGRSLTMGEWAKELGVDRLTLWQRVNRYGYSVEDAFTMKGKLRRKH